VVRARTVLDMDSNNTIQVALNLGCGHGYFFSASEKARSWILKSHPSARDCPNGVYVTGEGEGLCYACRYDDIVYRFANLAMGIRDVIEDDPQARNMEMMRILTVLFEQRRLLHDEQSSHMVGLWLRALEELGTDLDVAILEKGYQIMFRLCLDHSIVEKFMEAGWEKLGLNPAQNTPRMSNGTGDS
jgi:hypothetical protein